LINIKDNYTETDTNLNNKNNIKEKDIASEDQYTNSCFNFLLFFNIGQNN